MMDRELAKRVGELEQLNDHEKGEAFVLLSGMASASVENLAMLPDGVFVAALKLMLRPNRDSEWANTVCIPFKKIPVSIQDLELAINAPLLAPLPVSKERFKELERVFGAKANELFVTPDRFFAEDISGLASLILSPLNANASEGIYDLSLPHLWNLLVSVLEVWPITVSRNFCDHSSSTSKKTRPDLLFWVYDRLVLKTEHKRYESELFEAWDDLRSKMTSLDKIFYGKIEWILGLATAAGKFRFGAFKRGEHQHLTPEWNLASIKDRYSLLQASINVLRITLSWQSVFEEHPVRRPFASFEPVTYGDPWSPVTRTFAVVDGVPAKTIRPWSAHVGLRFTKLEYVQQAYNLDDATETLISGTTYVKQGRRADVYTVEMEALGISRLPRGHELKAAVLDVLKALQSLHEHGFVHRDVRWKNVVLDISEKYWVLIDLETVWVDNRVPECRPLQPWEPGTLDDDGRYTAASDLYLVGLMLFRYELTVAGKAFQDSLLRKELQSAAAAITALTSLELSEELF